MTPKSKSKTHSTIRPLTVLGSMRSQCVAPRYRKGKQRAPWTITIAQTVRLPNQTQNRTVGIVDRLVIRFRRLSLQLREGASWWARACRSRNPLFQKNRSLNLKIFLPHPTSQYQGKITSIQLQIKAAIWNWKWNILNFLDQAMRA